MQAFMTESQVASMANRRVTSQRLLTTPQSIQQKPPKKTGALKKYSPALFAGWQTRHVEIKDGILKYFKDVDG